MVHIYLDLKFGDQRLITYRPSLFLVIQNISKVQAERGGDYAER